nr:Nad1 [Zea mays]
METYIAVPAEILCLILPLLLGVAFLVLAERKVMAFVQRRKGPDVVGSFGLLQPLADGFKLILKEPISPSSANFSLFRMAPVATFMLSLVAWAVVPFDYGMVLSDPNIGLLYLFAISSLGVYGIIIAGWSYIRNMPFKEHYDLQLKWSLMKSLLVLFLLLYQYVQVPVIRVRLSWRKSRYGPVFPCSPYWLCSLFLVKQKLIELRLISQKRKLNQLQAIMKNMPSSMGSALFFLGEYANMILMRCGALHLTFVGLSSASRPFCAINPSGRRLVIGGPAELSEKGSLVCKHSNEPRRTLRRPF